MDTYTTFSSQNYVHAFSDIKFNSQISQEMEKILETLESPLDNDGNKENEIACKRKFSTTDRRPSIKV